MGLILIRSFNLVFLVFFFSLYKFCVNGVTDDQDYYLQIIYFLAIQDNLKKSLQTYTDAVSADELYG